MRKRIGVVGLRTVHELRGIACHALETQPPAKQSTCVSRTFGQAVRDPNEVRDAIASFAERAAAKLRAARQVCGALQVFAATDRLIPPRPVIRPRDRRGLPRRPLTAAPFSPPRPGYSRISDARAWPTGKAGVVLLDLSSEDSVAPTLFPEAPSDHLMRAVDSINARHGRGAHRLGAAATGAAWRMRQQHRSPRSRPAGKNWRQRACRQTSQAKTARLRAPGITSPTDGGKFDRSAANKHRTARPHPKSRNG